MLSETVVVTSPTPTRCPTRYSVIKRVLDVTVCVLLLAFVSPLVLVISLVILLESGWPIFFVQERVGQDRRRFRMYKFRTLDANYDPLLGREFMQAFVRGEIGGNDRSDGKRIYKPIDLARITAVGRYLRRTSLDELPQLLNVLRGDMSLVGPRPNVPWEVEAYSEWHSERLTVAPGITGLAQVRGRSGISFDEIAQHDIEYVRRRSLLLDLQILWWTLESVFRGRGAS